MANEVIALGYYDGATEGLVKDFGIFGPIYFKLVAWDELQDMKLFAATKIDKNAYFEISKLLLGHGDNVTSPVWVPKWEFGNKVLEKKADRIVLTLEERVKKPDILVYCDDILSKYISIIEPDNIAQKKLSSINWKNLPEPIQGWLHLLG